MIRLIYFSFLLDIFSLFASESGSYVTREEMERMLHVVDGKVPDTLRKCFSEVYLKTRILSLSIDSVLTISCIMSLAMMNRCLCACILEILNLTVGVSTEFYAQRYITLTTAIFVNLKVTSSTVKMTLYFYSVRKHTPTLSHQHTHACTGDPVET